jgi:hypothetical protein
VSGGLNGLRPRSRSRQEHTLRCARSPRGVCDPAWPRRGRVTLACLLTCGIPARREFSWDTMRDHWRSLQGIQRVRVLLGLQGMLAAVPVVKQADDGDLSGMRPPDSERDPLIVRGGSQVFDFCGSAHDCSLLRSAKKAPRCDSRAERLSKPVPLFPVASRGATNGIINLRRRTFNNLVVGSPKHRRR